MNPTSYLCQWLKTSFNGKAVFRKHYCKILCLAYTKVVNRIDVLQNSTTFTKEVEGILKRGNNANWNDWPTMLLQPDYYLSCSRARKACDTEIVNCVHLNTTLEDVRVVMLSARLMDFVGLLYTVSIVYTFSPKNVVHSFHVLSIGTSLQCKQLFSKKHILMYTSSWLQKIVAVEKGRKELWRK